MSSARLSSQLLRPDTQAWTAGTRCDSLQDPWTETHLICWEAPMEHESMYVYISAQDLIWFAISSFRSLTWRQIWRVASRDSGSPELLGSSRTSPEVPQTSPENFGDFPGGSLTVELNSNPEVPRKLPKLPRTFPKPAQKFRDFPGGQPLSLGSLTPSPESQKLSLKN